ncbi:MAG: hypothetical protein ACRC62_17940 [Microcoleus sp.]
MGFYCFPGRGANPVPTRRTLWSDLTVAELSDLMLRLLNEAILDFRFWILDFRIVEIGD